ncbi:2-oxoglutarate and oxygenase superfamily protein [Perilla frutescens var. hirtella]|nr:2-oxoglutarate and oxygenase superfamily protein [Perilla frutescens var. frutescens]KAH6776425.1 2-oxoglutarate and oxygenase superfamily protein [Perilla frutescens var. hirtella]
MAERRRLILGNFLSPEICKELEFIHKSCCTVGYRPNVFSTTLSHLIATNSSHLIMPFVPIRERLKEKVEEYFGCEYELFVEFTGLISWCKGASIGWHSDDNREHLKQRDFSAVCYLNNYGVDFHGGLFHFQDGEPSTIAPMAGDVVLYTADDRNTHSVSEISEGERITLALWFSRDASHDEDAKLLKYLSSCSLSSQIGSIASCIPMLASSNMYWFPPEEASSFQTGFNICSARLYVLGFDVCFPDTSDKECQLAARDPSSKILKLLEEPLCLTRGDELLSRDFFNILHALQVVQFYCWKVLESEKVKRSGPSIDVVSLSELQREKISCLKAVLLKDLRLAETIVGRADCRSLLRPFDFDRLSFCSLVSDWEAYTFKLRNELVMSLPYWRTHQSIFCVANLH